MPTSHARTVRRLGRGALLLPLAAALVSLTACSSLLPGDTSGSPPAETSLPSATAPAADADTLRAYYESLLAELKQELLDAKQTDYITRLEYESRIAELEAHIAALEDSGLGDLEGSGSPDISVGADRLPAASDIPASGDPDPLPPAETAPVQNAPAASFSYEIRDDFAVILAYLGSARAVTVPAAIGGYPVTHIADDAFKATGVTSVILPDSVTHVGWFAFSECPGLVSVTLPASVASIGYGAFDGSPSVTIFCPRDSYAAEYARSFALPVRYT